MSAIVITTFTSGTEDLAMDKAKGQCPTLPTPPFLYIMMQVVQVVRSGPSRSRLARGHGSNWCMIPTAWCRPRPTYPRPTHRGCVGQGPGGRVPRGLSYARLPTRLSATSPSTVQIIVGNPCPDFSWNSETNRRENSAVAFAIAIKRRSRKGGYEWVVDWFDPRRGARFEAIFSTRAQASACMASIVAELTL